MATTQRETLHAALDTFAQYENLKRLRQLVKNYYNLRKAAENGDDMSAAIYIDIKTCLQEDSNLMTDLERQCIVLVDVEQLTLKDAAALLGLKTSWVHENITRGLLKMSKALVSGDAYRRPSERVHSKWYQRRKGNSRKRLSKGKRPYVRKN